MQSSQVVQLVMAVRDKFRAWLRHRLPPARRYKAISFRRYSPWLCFPLSCYLLLRLPILWVRILELDQSSQTAPTHSNMSPSSSRASRGSPETVDGAGSELSYHSPTTNSQVSEDCDARSDAADYSDDSDHDDDSDYEPDNGSEDDSDSDIELNDGSDDDITPDSIDRDHRHGWSDYEDDSDTSSPETNDTFSHGSEMQWSQVTDSHAMDISSSQGTLHPGHSIHGHEIPPSPTLNDSDAATQTTPMDLSSTQPYCLVDGVVTPVPRDGDLLTRLRIERPAGSPLDPSQSDYDMDTSQKTIRDGMNQDSCSDVSMSGSQETNDEFPATQMMMDTDEEGEDAPGSDRGATTPRQNRAALPPKFDYGRLMGMRPPAYLPLRDHSSYDLHPRLRGVRRSSPESQAPDMMVTSQVQDWDDGEFLPTERNSPIESESRLRPVGAKLTSDKDEWPLCEEDRQWEVGSDANSGCMTVTVVPVVGNSKYSPCRHKRI